VVELRFFKINPTTNSAESIAEECAGAGGGASACVPLLLRPRLLQRVASGGVKVLQNMTGSWGSNALFKF
jgi:hypothetical protein